MKVHVQGKKFNLVLDPKELAEIALCLSESPTMKHRILAFKITGAMEDLNKRSSK